MRNWRQRAPSLARTGHFVRARFAHLRRGAWPIPTIVFLAAFSAVVASLARESLPPFPHAFLALSLGPLVLGVPLLADLAALLRLDEAAEWAGSLPAQPSERLLARLAHALAWLAALVLAWFVPWALLAPAGSGWALRLLLPGVGFVLVLALGALLIWAQQLLLRFWSWPLILLESVWTVAVVVGTLGLLGRFPDLAGLAPDAPELAWIPSTWLARALTSESLEGLVLLPIALTASVFGLLALPATESRPPTTRTLLERWLVPLRKLAARHWVRRDELGTFQLVFSALGREREFAMRTYPMIGIPLAFLWLAARGGAASWRSDVLALLLFTSGTSFPLLLVHLPLTESPEAAWLQRVAPISDHARREGALKAVFVRWVAPLYLALLALTLALGHPLEALRLWLPATIVAFLILRWLHPRCVRDLPLSTAPEDLHSDLSWTGAALPMALGLTILAVVANRLLTLEWSLAASLGLFLFACARPRGGRAWDAAASE